MGNKLTAVGVRALVKPGRYVDGGGLHLHVRAADRRAWVFRYTRQGKTRDMGLGAFPDVSLAEARKAAEAARLQLREGQDPVASRQEKATARSGPRVSFAEAAEEYIQAQSDGWRSAKHAAQWRATLVAHAFPVIGAVAVQDVDVEAVLRILQPIWLKTPETASRLRGRLELVLDAARARGWRSGENPARWKGNLAGMLPARKRVAKVKHQPSLPWQRVGAFVAELRTEDGTAARALELAILTAARTGEVRGARWSEFDLDAAVWTIPGERMKAGRMHRVPLSGPALGVLRAALPTCTGADAFVFLSPRLKRPLSDMALLMLVRRMNRREGEAAPRWCDLAGRPIVPHGFRSTFRVWAGECAPYPREVIEAALSHTVQNKVEAAYARTDLLERRRPLMEEWGALSGEPAEDAHVVRIAEWHRPASK